MTREEAARCFERLRNDAEDMAEKTEKIFHDVESTYRKFVDLYSMAISALRVTDTVTETVTDSHQLETVTKCHDTDGCEYCRESENIYYHAGEVNALDELLYITGDDLVVDIGCRFYLAASIKFCPMCGRRLEDD